MGTDVTGKGERKTLLKRGRIGECEFYVKSLFKLGTGAKILNRLDTRCISMSNDDGGNKGLPLTRTHIEQIPSHMSWVREWQVDP